MLQLLDESLEAFLRTETPLAKDEVDVAFEAPDDEWAATVTKPTLNLFLWDIRRSADETDTGREQVAESGKMFWRQRPPRIEFRYLCTAWTTEVIDEHRLLGSVLTTLVAHRELPEGYLKGALLELTPRPTLKVARPDGKDFAEFWSALEGQLKPGLDIVVTATVDPKVLVPAGEPTDEMGIRTADTREPSRTSGRNRVAGRVANSDAAGAVVRSPRGASTVRDDGSFLVEAEPGDEVVVETAEPKRGVVPERGEVVVG